MMKKRKKIVFWRDVPVDVEKGAFTYINQNWGNDILFVCSYGYSKERLMCEWDSGDLNQIILSEEKDPEEKIKKIMKDNEDSIHFFYGFRGETSKILKKYFKKNNKTFCVIAERPNYYNKSIFKNFAKNLLYKYYSIVYKNQISLFLAMGIKGVKEYKDIGFDERVLFPFMYNPLVEKKQKEVADKKSGEIKFLYVGRLSSKFKGVDTLIDSLDMIKPGCWEIDFVGGYGDLKDKIVQLSITKNNVNFKGSWLSNEVINNMKSYDICIIPSKYDGWNLVANEAINAGIGVIITDQATSDELVKESNCGFVIKSNNAKELSLAINNIIDNPSKIKDFKKNAQSYSPLISSEIVGGYFIDVLDYIFEGNTNLKRPVCPWLKENI